MVKPPLILGIETSNPSAGAAEVALMGAQELLGREAVRTEPHSDDLITAIDRLFQGAGRRARELTVVAVSVGPGGYTAVRIAITTAKMICEATGAACHPVPTAHVVAWSVRHGGPFGVALASKGETAFVTRFRGRVGGELPQAVDAGRLIRAGELEGCGVSLLVADRFLPEGVRARAGELGIALAPPRFDAAAVARLSTAFAAVDPAVLAPLYPREPEAVTKWRELRGG